MARERIIRARRLGAVLLLAVFVVSGLVAHSAAKARPRHRFRKPVKVLIINMFGPEGQPFIDALQRSVTFCAQRPQGFGGSAY
jgi:purine nucleoside permease